MNYPGRLKNHPIAGMVLNVTDACNLGCKYCFTHPNPSKMSLDTGIQAVKWYLEENAKKDLEGPKTLSISFFGGEPTLRWDDFVVPLIKYIKAYIEPVYKDRFPIRFSCTTNGQLLDEEKISFFIKNRGSFLLSIDGDRESQNINRPRLDKKDSFDAVNKNIDILLKYQPGITFRSTVTPETAKNLSHDYLFARNRGFKNWFTIPNVRQNWSKDDIKTLQEEMLIITGILLRDISLKQEPLCFNWLNRFIKGIMVGVPQKQHFIRCGLGTTSIGVATDGSLFACQENSTYHDEKNPFFIGDVWQGINEERHKNLLRNFSGDNKVFCKDNCKNCILNGFCQSWSCPSTNFAMTNNVMERPEPMCEWLKILYLSAANMILNAAEKNCMEFIEWVQKNTELMGGV